VLAGFVDNTVRMCEPGVPHAWPTDYTFTMDSTVVGLGVFGGQLVVCTQGVPYLITGSHPANMSVARLNYKQACVSKRSIAGLQTGVMYASPNGLVFVSAGGVSLLTEAFMERDDWDDYTPSSMVGVIYDDRYYGFYTDGGTDRGAIIFDRLEPDAQLYTLDLWCDGAWHQDSDDTLYVVRNGTISQYDAGGATLTAYHKSGIIRTKRPAHMTVGRVRYTSTTGASSAEQAAAITAGFTDLDTKAAAFTLHNNGGIGGFMPGQYTVGGGPYLDVVNANSSPSDTVTLQIYVDGTLAHTEAVSSSDPFRIPDIGVSDEYEIALSGLNAQIHDVTLAETMSELAGVP